MIDFTKKNHIIIAILMIFWGIMLFVLLSMAQPLPPITKLVLIVCMIITALSILLDKKPIGGISGAIGSFMMVALGAWSLLIILSGKLINGYYREQIKREE